MNKFKDGDVAIYYNKKVIIERLYGHYPNVYLVSSKGLKYIYEIARENELELYSVYVLNKLYKKMKNEHS